ncbi:glycosyltransferase, partial [Candidatus Omnitrophota bacterium]
MRKIIFLHMSIGVGGAEKLRLFLLKNIDKERYNVKICCLGKKGIIGEEIEKFGYSVDELRQDPSSKSLYVTYKLYKYLIKERPDILHCSLFSANFHGRIAGFLCRVPHLITEEHSEHFQYNGLKFLPYRLMDYILCRITDFIVCCSERLRQDIVIKERLPAKKTLTIENCVDLADCKVNTSKEEIRKKHGINSELVFIVVASLSARK